MCKVVLIIESWPFLYTISIHCTSGVHRNYFQGWFDEILYRSSPYTLRPPYLATSSRVPAVRHCIIPYIIITNNISRRSWINEKYIYLLCAKLFNFVYQIIFVLFIYVSIYTNTLHHITEYITFMLNLSILYIKGCCYVFKIFSTNMKFPVCG